MSTNLQSGVTALHIIAILAVFAVLFGIASTFMADSQPETTDIAATAADTTKTQSPIEEMAQTKAERETVDMMEAVEERTMKVESEMMDDDISEQGVDKPKETDSAVTSKIIPTPTVAGTFSDYSAEKLSLAQNGTVVLFFHANWCPSCRGLENDINASLSAIPENTHILKLDYDTETELKKKYGVVRQHTLVVIDANGTEIKKITGLTNTLSQVASQL